ncbi:hypothetical protein B296_00039784 [Ensete ventricosum]|uniref:Uncharacterized protein n=1 Tax=Ensete ventricosum TaxID=4639 RepID=A0A426XDX5_ENSVE|nr:hypothetical protein B296_00039784 [Ensete ventricosum]
MGYVMLPLRFPNNGIRAKGWLATTKAPYKGGWPRPRSPAKGLPAAPWAAHKSDRPRPARSQSVASLWQRLPSRGSPPRPAYGRGYRRWAATAHKGNTCGHGARRKAAYGQKLSPARAGTHRNARKGGAHGGVACPLAGRLPAGKGSCRLRRGDDGDDAIRVR